MNGYKTGGDWTDVTSIGRNEVVFEGRHKAYGAFYIRKRYPNALYFSFLTAITCVALGVYVPYALRNIHPPLPPLDRHFKADPTVIIPYVIPPPPPAHPNVQPPRMTPNLNHPPVITPRIDSAPPPIVDNHTIPVTGNPNPGGPPNTGDPGVGAGGGPVTIVPPVDNPPRMWVSEMPKFPGGDVVGYVGGKIRYSAEDIQLGIQGTVIASFVIEQDGSVSSVKILRGINGGPDLNNEAIRVLSEMPKWTPGKQDGHPVRMQFTIPIQFRLQ
jgi:protein TonB